MRLDLSKKEKPVKNVIVNVACLIGLLAIGFILCLFVSNSTGWIVYWSGFMLCWFLARYHTRHEENDWDRVKVRWLAPVMSWFTSAVLICQIICDYCDNNDPPEWL